MELTKQEQFFHDNAGFSYGPGEEPELALVRAAKEFAKAETWALQNGYEFREVEDLDADLSWMSDKQREQPHDTVCIQMLDPNGNVVGSLGDITDMPGAYKRTVRAELALAQMKKVVG